MTHPLNRRAVLRGFAGALIGLPLLEYTHGKAWAQGGPPPLNRFIVFFAHGGTLTNVAADGSRYSGNRNENGVCAWKPASPGEALDLGLIHKPVLQQHVGALTLLRGVDNMAGKLQSDYNGGHGWCNVTALTSGRAVRIADGDEGIVPEVPSFDHVLAARLQERNPVAFPLVHLTLDAHNYGSPFYRAARQRVYGETSPRRAFDTLFANVVEGGGGGPDPAVLRARALKKSILDGTREGLSQLSPRLSTQDRQAVEAHLEHIRELERRVSALDVPVAAACTKPPRPGEPAWDSPTKMPDIAMAHVDLMVAALKCGLTNVICLEMGDMETGWLNPPYEAGYNIGHSLHHDGNEMGATGALREHREAWWKSMLENQQWRATVLARFMDGMQALEPDGKSMLHHSLALWTSEFSTGGAHSGSDVPLLLAGHAGGRLVGGRHYNHNVKEKADPSSREYETRASVHNVFTSILNLYGYPDTHFGSEGHAFQTGPLPGLV